MTKSVTKKALFEERFGKLTNSRNKYASSLSFSHRVTELFDNEINIVTNEDYQDLAIVAHGGYGRHEYSPYSDVDVMFLSENPETHREIIGKIVTSLWDRGMKISHTVKSINQIEELAKTDIISFCQFLELRFISGSKNLFKKFIEEINRVLQSDLSTILISELISDIEKRHSLCNNSPFLLEPNVKQSPGGLRDFHSAVWLKIILDKELSEINSYEPVAISFLEELLKERVINKEDLAVLTESFDYIQKIRQELHLFAKSNPDRLDFALQQKLSASLSLMFESDANSQKLMMARYFYSAEQIFNFLTLIKKIALGRLYEIEKYDTYILTNEFSVKGRFLIYDSEENLSLSSILTAFQFKSNLSTIFSDKLRKDIIRSLKEMEGFELSDLELAAKFREILRTSENIGEVIMDMSRTGLLGVLIPEFADLKGFFQPNAYHIYTADEHTMVALKNLSQLRFEDSLLGDIFRKHKNTEVLIMSVICHDIAKPHTLSGHEIVGSQICESVMERLGYDDEDIRLASFLVANHLIMEQIAFRRNIHDSATLDNFRRYFSSVEYLDFLYLLTYADLSAVNPSSWTAWKNSLLDELYYLTSKLIIENIEPETLLTDLTPQMDFSELSINKTDYLEHVAMINDPHYFYAFDEREIVEHIQEIKNGKDVSIFFNNESNFTKLTVVTYDKTGLLAKICGAIALSDITIHDAKIFTRKDNVVIDNFTVCSIYDHKPLSRDQIEEATKNITMSVFETFNLEQFFNEHKEKWKRLEKKYPKSVGVEISFEEHPVYTIIDIYTSDRIGLLYTITKAMTELELNIHFSKIGTKLNGVFDSFYVLDKSNRKIHRSQFTFIKNALIKALCPKD